MPSVKEPRSTLLQAGTPLADPMDGTALVAADRKVPTYLGNNGNLVPLVRQLLYLWLFRFPEKCSIILEEGGQYKQMNQPQLRKPPMCRIEFTLLLSVVSALLVCSYPQRIWLFGLSLGTLATITIFLRVGWAIPCMIAGTYVGLFANGPVRSGPIDAQMWQDVQAIVVFSIAGLVTGLAIDNWKKLDWPSEKKGDKSKF